MVPLFLEDSLEILMALILKSGQEIELFFAEYFQFLRKEKSEKWKLKFPAEGQDLAKQMKQNIFDQFYHLYIYHINIINTYGCCIPLEVDSLVS